MANTIRVFHRQARSEMNRVPNPRTAHTIQHSNAMQNENPFKNLSNMCYLKMLNTLSTAKKPQNSTIYNPKIRELSLYIIHTAIGQKINVIMINAMIRFKKNIHRHLPIFLRSSMWCIRQDNKYYNTSYDVHISYCW